MKSTKFPIDFPIDFSIGRDITWPKKATEKPAAAHDPATGRQDKAAPAKVPLFVQCHLFRSDAKHGDFIVIYHLHIIL